MPLAEAHYNSNWRVPTRERVPRAAQASAGIAWRYASLANLPRALEDAHATKKNVLVGLSGAET